MKKTTRKGFTIVELVIVIAVIAILAAVLIPTFSSLIAKANLSSDQQAVRSMNIALESHEKLHGKCTTLEEAMQVIANAGYETDNWTCLSKGYEVYWFSTKNRCILYNASEATVAYPEEFTTKKYGSNLLTGPEASNCKLYNQNFKNALNQDFSFGSSGSQINTGGVTLGSANANGKFEVTLGSGNAAVEIDRNALTSATGKEDVSNVKLYGYSENKSSSTGAYAFVKSYAAYEEQPDLTSSSQVKPNLYVIGVTVPKGATAEQRVEAEKAAGTYVYSLLVQIAEDKVEEEASIYLEPGTTLNLSEQEWAGYAVFEGYFGTSDAANPIIIDGMKLTSATGYANTYQFSGTGSYYYMTGFFGALTGNATVENVVFKNIHIENPASDFGVSETSSDSNCASVLGGVVATPGCDTVNINIRNVKIENSCSVQGVSRVGGLLAYVGGYSGGKPEGLGGTINIEGCEVACSVKTTKVGGYGSAGGIIGFINKTYNALASQPLNITIKDTKFTGSIYSSYAGGVIGYFSPSTGKVNNVATPGSVNLTLTNVTASPTITINPAVGYSATGTGFIGQVVGAASVAGANSDGATLTVDGVKVTNEMTSAEIRAAFEGKYNPNYKTQADGNYYFGSVQ